MFKNKISTTLIAGGTAIVGMVAGTALIASAQSASTTGAVPTATTSSGFVADTIDTPESANDPADTDMESSTYQHAPLGGDGVVSSVSATSISLGHGGEHADDKANDTDGGQANEAGESVSSSDASDQ